MPDTTAPAPPPLTSLPLFADAAPGPAGPSPSVGQALAGAGPAGHGLPPASAPDQPAPAGDGPAAVGGLLAQQQGRIDWGLVRAFRQQAASQLALALRDREGLDENGRHELGRRIVLDLLSQHVEDALASGADTFSADEQQILASAVFDSLFSLGRLQNLVDDPNVENIEIYGHRKVVLEYAGGRLEEGPAVADSDEELIENLQFLASRTGGNDRPFSALHPHLHLRLPGGARLAAAAWITHVPVVVIRRHRLVRIGLGDLADLDMFSHTIASFLTAAVRYPLSVMVAGPMGAGKTTMLRALCAALPVDEHIGTFETEYELHLHDMPDQHWRVTAFEARPGNGEVGADGRRAGAVTLDEHLESAWRHNLSRLVVGELRGTEITALFEAMQGAAGSMSSVHSYTARGAVGRLTTLAMKAGFREDFAAKQVSENVQLIVQLKVDVEEVNGRRYRRRYVSEILALEPRGDGPPTQTTVFRAGADGRAVPDVLPESLRGLQAHGFDTTGFSSDTPAGQPGWSR